jgi:hypothetical protein
VKLYDYLQRRHALREISHSLLRSFAVIYTTLLPFNFHDYIYLYQVECQWVRPALSLLDNEMVVRNK